MTTRKNSEHMFARSIAKEAAAKGEYVPIICMIAAQCDDIDCCDANITDLDGHNIVAKGTGMFSFNTRPEPTLTFAPGMNRSELARVLRKFVDLLEDPHGIQVVNLRDGEFGLNRAERHPDGSVVVYNHDERMEEDNERYLQQHAPVANTERADAKGAGRQIAKRAVRRE